MACQHEGIDTLAPTYADARRAFLDAARAASARLDHHVHPGRGRDGEELAIDVAELGPPDAARAVLIVSATHGVEGYAGSALQTRWLAEARDERPDDVRVVLVHGLNPYGFSWVRRVNEDNVDLNRNFVDWTRPPPPNPGYDEIADLLVPAAWTPAEQERTTLALLTVADERGMDHLQQVISGGQYTHPTGIFHGGSGPVWSHRTLRADLTARFDASCEDLTIIDLHTGLGPWGHGELIVHDAPGTDAYDRTVRVWGDEVRAIADGSSVSAVLSGDWLAAAPSFVPRAAVTSAALEFGTVDLVTVLQALRADAWLHAHGDPHGPEGDAIRAQVRAAFADDDPAWSDALWERFEHVASRALGV